MLKTLLRKIRGIPDTNNFNPRFRQVLRKWYRRGYEKGYLEGKEAPKYCTACEIERIVKIGDIIAAPAHAHSCGKELH